MDQGPHTNYQPLMADQTVPVQYNTTELQNYNYPAGMPPGYMPMPQQNFNPPPVQQQYVTAPGLQILEPLAGIFIKQKLELAEALIGWQTKNRYHVYALDETGNKRGPRLFKGKENSGCCERQCLAASCRPFQMDVNTVHQHGESDSYEPFLSLSRPCKWTCLCLNRPELSVKYVEGGQEVYLGKITEPFRCCNKEQIVFDKDNLHKYTIFGSCGQLGFWCRCPCDPCQTIDFAINTASGEQVGLIQKRGRGCLKEAFSDADSFAVHFPKNCSTSDKALIMSAVLFLDYNYFETNPNADNNGNNA